MLITSKPTIDVKADIWNMPQLRHLRTNKPAKLPPPTTSTSSTNSYLQTLSLVAPESCKEDVLAKAGNLQKISVKGNLTAFEFKVLKFLENLTRLNDDKSDKALHLPSAFSNVYRI
ncbi:hypothetical protein CQW23_12086 [Capsicum baccatum]|uniref:Uncharacterized protein n=1 Tax=Capsicum baccatum TaxID=33114 RepID=A0A2G2WRJ3_CAPBA|nr:hypothetical protein CQW23_12086 [Capsicum baccatum]